MEKDLQIKPLSCAFFASTYTYKHTWKRDIIGPMCSLIYLQKRPIQMKIIYIHMKRDLQIEPLACAFFAWTSTYKHTHTRGIIGPRCSLIYLQKRPTKQTHKSEWQKRSTKETCKRDLQSRPTKQTYTTDLQRSTKETYNRDLQKRSTIETYRRDLQ